MESMIQSALIADQQSLFIIGIIFVTGLLTSLTPCVYPMLPITVSVIGSQASNKRQSIHFSLIYVLGLALFYSLLGMLAASTGQLFGTVASHPLTLIIVGTFCLLMAAWMLGWINPMNNPAMPQLSFSQPWLNVFVAGCLSGLVMAPCTSPVLGMLLMYVASEGNRLWAALLMFVFAFGMSALLILAGSFSGFMSSIPRSGKWLNLSKYLMAALMGFTALYLFYQAI
ncbi:cytochrome c biogenesis protein CcdA [Oceanospirillum sediminis]|uniref:Sulfite exporter TauE/SafE family protein n=1 Tax=Oceanospirillum sediminis TaxID=2760088 RepID=A0A839ISU5_9GAMM|nr:cytochrome c biogenesis protein CcdA [Oceanospirillum sediminis]MBB1488021.1 sulfite exporter TauE/SafE family protein [Oceanospirillum sediminis]